MAIIFSEDLTRDQGKLTNANLVQGAWRTVSAKTDLDLLTGSAANLQLLENGQLFWARTEEQFYRYKVVQVGLSQIRTFEEFSFVNQNENILSGSILTSSISNFDSEVSRSAAIAGFGSGGGSVAAGTVSSSAQTIANLNGTNILSGSILTSSVTNFNTEVSRSAAASGFGASTLPSGVVSSSAQVSYVLISNIPSGIVSSSTQTIANLNGSGILSGSSSVPAGTISGSQQITDLGFINQSQTSSMSVATASYVSPTFISASAAASGFGASTLPSGVVSSSAQVVAALPAGTVSSSAQILPILTSSVTNFDTEVSRSAAASGFGSGGGSTDISSLNTFTGSIQSEVNALKAATSSYVTSAQTSSFVTNSQTASFALKTEISGAFTQDSSSISTRLTSLEAGGGSVPAGTISGSQQITDLGFINQSQTSSMSVATASFAQTASFIGNLNYNFITNLPNLISSSAQIALLGAGILSASAQIAGEISGAFTSLSSSFQSRITALEGAGGGSGIFTLTGSFYSTTNNVKITGSLSVGSGSFKSFEVNSDGFIILGDMNKDLNNAPEGTIAYSGSSFYLIT